MPDLIIREYNFVNGPETPTLPTAGTPTDSNDTITKRYGDKSYWRSVATVAALKAISTSDRSLHQIFYVASLGALFRYDSASSATGNDITVITPTDTTGRYLLLTQSPMAGEIELDSSTTGSDQTLSTPTKTIRACSNASLSSIAGITAPVIYQLFIWVNKTGNLVTIKDQNAGASAANRIMTGTSSDLLVANGASVWFLYDLGATIWRIVGGSGGGGSSRVFGSTGSPRSIVAGTGITSGASHMSTSATDQMIFLKGSVAGAVCDISVNPQMEAHTIIGARQTFVGASDAEPVLLESGNGFILNGPWTGYNNSVLKTFWNGSSYVEESRNGV